MTVSDDRAEMIARMQLAGQTLALQWGHPPWSDSWAQLVAETLLEAAWQRCGEGLPADL